VDESLHGEEKISRNHPGAKQIYDSEVQRHLVTLWESCGRLCSKKWAKLLKNGCRFIMRRYQTDIGYFLQSRRKLIEKGQTTTSPSVGIGKFPIKLLNSPIIEPGFVEADTVAHSRVAKCLRRKVT
jgi:hypothetical protein